MATEATLVPRYKAEYGTLKHYVDGRFVAGRSGRELPVVDPATGEEIASVPLASADEVGEAIAAAKAAFPAWRAVPPQDRIQHFFRLKALLEERLDDIARIITQEHGKTLGESRGSVRRAIEHVEVATGTTSLMMGYNLEDGAGRGIDEEMVRQPLGVFGCIAPFNFPVMVPFWFWPYAVATGNTYVIKPSEQDPISQQLVFELIEEAGFPAGVVNLVNGDREAAQVLLEHPDIVGVSFVGSTPVARAVYTEGCRNGKRVQAQGGAKNHLVVMPDANFDRASSNWINSIYGCAGERCLAGSVLVPVGEEAHRRTREAFVAAAERVVVGSGLDERVDMGPVISAAARDRILAAIDKGLAEGADLVLDGRTPDVVTAGCEDGYFVGPTVFDNVTPDMSLAREEIFGPVASIMPVGSLSEALEVIAESPFGNAASIYTSDGGAARTFASRADAGNIGVNVGVPAAMAYFPFAGRKDSFFGTLHGQGRDAIDFFTDKKVVIKRWYWDEGASGTWS